MVELWSEFSALMESYYKHSTVVTSYDIEKKLKSLLSHEKNIVDILVCINDDIATFTLFSSTSTNIDESSVYAYLVRHAPILVDRVIVNVVCLNQDAICKGEDVIVPEKAPTSMADALSRTAANFPQKTLTFSEATGDQQTITYQQLYQNARTVAACLAQADGQSQRAVVLVAGEMSAYITAFWGCVLAGRPSLTVMLAPEYTGDDINKTKLCQAISVLEPEFVICCDEGFRRISQAEEVIIGAELLRSGALLDMPPTAMPDLQTAGAASPLFYQLTSGSTGEAKVIAISEAAVLGQIHSVNQHCHYHSDHVSLNWLPFDHVIALLAVHLHDVYLGRQQIHLATSLVLADPLYWVRQLELHQVTHCFAPNFIFKQVLEQLAKEPEHNICDLSRLEQIVSGGEAVAADSVTHFLQAFDSAGIRNTVIQPSYGMAEAAAGVSFEQSWTLEDSVIDLKTINGAGDTEARVTSLGCILPGLAMQIVDSDQQVLKEREVGEIQLAGHKLCHGSNGWFRTGDLGFIDQQRLFVTGRLKDVIIINGANHYSHQLEGMIADIDGVRSGFVAVVGYSHDNSESIAVFYVPEDEAFIATDDTYYLSQIVQIKRVLGKSVGLAASVVLPVTEEQFPKTSIGKIKRTSLQHALKAGEFVERIHTISALLSARWLDTTRRHHSSIIISDLRSIWMDVLGVEGIDDNANFFELGGNSVLSARLISQVNHHFNLCLDTVALFEAPNIAAMGEMLSNRKPELFGNNAKAGQVEKDHKTGSKDIAIIGMAGIFPGAANIDEFWQKLLEGEELMTQFSEQELAEAGLSSSRYSHEDYVARGGYVEGTDEFDAAFFNYPLKDAELMDPQSRLLHQQCWHALENAGYVPANYPGAIGLYVGASSGCNIDWMNRASRAVESEQFSDIMTLHTLADRDFIATRIAYAIGLTGPAVTVQTACSTGLVATHSAIQSLREGSCDIALSGAASVKPVKQGYTRQSGMMLSESGICRPFDAEADGTVFTEGVGVVALKLLDRALNDGDNIIAVIKGAAVNNDGRQKAGYLAPGIHGQEAVIRGAFADAQVDPDSIGYIEAHGTATQLGDPIEVKALTNVFKDRETPLCRLGSVKSNIGHAEAAAGIAGLIKSALAVHHKKVPASLHYRHANTQIDFASSPFQVNSRLWNWEGALRPYRAGVSSFGIGGTNAHVIVEEPPQAPAKSNNEESWVVLPVSAKSTSALRAAKHQLADFMNRSPHVSLADVAYTLGAGRGHFARRQAVVCRTAKEAQQVLEQPSRSLPLDQKKDVFLMFPGQGAQYQGMFGELFMAYRPFRHVVNQCLALLPEQLRDDLAAIISGEQHDADKLDDTRLVQPALFIVQYSLAKMLIRWGIEPKGMIGHSLGEYVAACISQVMTLDDALNLVVTRGRLMSQAEKGSMLGVSLTEDEVRQYLSETVNLAAVNGPSQCVLSGKEESIEQVEILLGKAGASFQRLPVSHAYHSYMMDGILAEFASHVASIPIQAPAIPYISTLTGSWVTDEVLNPDYWVRHLRETVCFNKGIELMMKAQNAVFLDMGPGKTLGSLIRQHPGIQPSHLVISLTRHQKETISDIEPLFNAAGMLYENGFDINWMQLNPQENACRIALPLYPFDKQTFELVLKGQENYRLTDANGIEASEEEMLGKRQRPISDIPYRAPETPNEKLVADFWSDELGIVQPGLDDAFFELGGDSLVMLRLVNRINEYFGTGLTVAVLMEAQTIKEQVMIAEMISTNQADETEDFVMDLGELL